MDQRKEESTPAGDKFDIHFQVKQLDLFNNINSYIFNFVLLK